MKMMKDRVKKIREDANLTMAEFGERIGINWRMVATLERGEREPTYTNITMICGYFSVNKEWLITGKGEMMTSDFLNTSEREKLIGELETIYPKLTTEQLKRVVKYGKTLTHYTGEFQKKKDNENDGNKKKNHVQ